jgi:two-component system, OmpR family, sensor histidine kinase TctE
MMTVRRRLLLLLLPELALLMLGGGVVDYMIAATTTRKAHDQALSNAGLALAAWVRPEQGRLVFAPPAIGLPAERGAQLVWEYYAIRGPDGAMIAGTLPLPPAGPTNGAGETHFTDLDWRGRRLRVASFVSPTPLGPVTIAVGETLERRERTERAILFGKLLVDFAELDVTLLLVWIAVYYGLRPLSRLHDQIEQRTPRQLQRFSETDTPEEVRPLIRGFNRLLELLHDAAASQRRFVADAAHQMRTPVAGLLAQLELLQQNPTAAAVLPELATLNRGIAQLAHSANQLLALARAEPLTTLPDEFKAVALPALVGELVERNIDRAIKLQLDLGAEAEDAEVTGDAWLLDDLASNLIDNALKYTPAGGRITVRCGLGPDGAPYLEVEDDGPGIPEAERARVRERFYRRPGSAGSGAGLGLAIVEEIARVHGARFSIEHGAGSKGSRMRVRFPAPPGAPAV